MTELSKERRDRLRDRTAHNVNGTNCVPINRDEFRALLDMADERDRYRALLVEAVKDVRANMPYRQPLADEIDAALEGKIND